MDRVEGQGPKFKAARPNLLSWSYKLNGKEVLTFFAPMERLLSAMRHKHHIPGPAEILKCEKRGILALDPSADLNELNKYRVKILGLMHENQRNEYSSLLLTLANLYSERGEFANADEVLKAVNAGDLFNWHAMNERAVVLFRLGDYTMALNHFERAREVLRKRNNYQVDKEQILEYSMIESRCRIEQKKKLGLEITTNELLRLMKPILFAPRSASEKVREYGELQRRKIQESIAQNENEFVKVAQVLRLNLEGEYLVVQLACQNIDRLYLREREKAESEARKLVRSVQSNDLISNATMAELQKYIDDKNREVEDEKLIERIHARIAKVEAGDLNLLDELMQEVKIMYQKTEQRSKYINWQGTIREFSRPLQELGIKTLKNGAVKRAVEYVMKLSEIDKEVGAVARSQIMAGLSESDAASAVMSEMLEIYKTIDGLADEVVGLPNPKVRAEIAEKLAKSKKFIEQKKVFDFFFTGMRENSDVKMMFKKLFVPYAEPASLLSCFYELLGDKYKGKDLGPKIKYYERACQADENNLSAHIELARLNGAAGHFSASEKINSEILTAADDPKVELRIYHIMIANICIKVAAMIGKAGKYPAIMQEIREAEAALAKARIAVEKDNLSDNFSLSDWLFIVRYMGHLYSLIGDYNKTIEYEDECLKLRPKDSDACQIKALTLLKQGKYVETVQFLKPLLNEMGAPNPDFVYLFAEALYKLNSISSCNYADREISRALKYHPHHLNLLIIRARIRISLQDIEGAKEMVSQLEKVTTSRPANIELVEWNKVLGSLELARAELFNIEDKRKQARTAYDKAIKYFSSDFESQYNALDACCRLVQVLSDWSKRDAIRQDEAASQIESDKLQAAIDKYLAEAIEMGSKLIREFPSFTPGHLALVAPLIASERSDEALNRLAFAANNPNGFTTEAMGSLLILSTHGEARIYQRSKELIYKLKSILGSDLFEKILESAEEALSKSHIDLPIDPDLRDFLLGI